MSLWALYIKERNNMDCIEDDDGFITFKIQGDECYIEDCFVRQQHRLTGFGLKLLEQVEEKAKAAGCKYLSACVHPKFEFSTGSMRAQLAVGFQVKAVLGDKIIMIKELL